MQDKDTATVIPWAFSPRTCSVGKAGIYIPMDTGRSLSSGRPEAGPVGRCDEVGRAGATREARLLRRCAPRNDDVVIASEAKQSRFPAKRMHYPAA